MDSPSNPAAAPVPPVVIQPFATDWRPPVLTVASMLLTLLAAQSIATTPSAAILGAVLAMTLSGNRLSTSWRGRAEAAILLPLIALSIGGVAGLLAAYPWAGALAFTLALSGAIWLRRYGPTGARIGGLLSLPFLSLIIVPGGGAGLAPWQGAAIAMTALGIVSAVRLAAEASGFLPALPVAATAGPARPPSSLRPIASTRMALQMAVALAAAFWLGVVLFPGHVTWVVLTAFVVCSGNRGRADVLYKSGLRLLGAAAGTLLSMPIGDHVIAAPLLVGLLLAIVGLGLWLRQITYAAWAVAMTLVVALLQDRIAPDVAGVDFPGRVLGWRLLAILTGAVCGVAASWFLLPVRSEPVVRRRVADVLAALQPYLQDASEVQERALRDSLLRLEEVAPPWRSWDRIRRWVRPGVGPAHWIALAQECTALALAHPARRNSARALLAEARRALKQPEALQPSLLRLRDHLVPARPDGPQAREPQKSGRSDPSVS